MPFATLQQHHDEMEAAGVKLNPWQFALCSACFKNPAGFCFGLCCFPCFAGMQRNRLLKDRNQPYMPCGGNFCCCSTASCAQEQGGAGYMCGIACEACCCPYLATMVNRDLVMTFYQVDWDACDEYIITCALCVSCIVDIAVCISAIVGGPTDELRALQDIVDLILCGIMSCSLAQQESQIDYATGVSTTLGGNYGSAGPQNTAPSGAGGSMGV